MIPVTTPILMLSGLQDEVVPAEQMKELWEIAKKRRTTRSNTLFKVRITLFPLMPCP